MKEWWPFRRVLLASSSIAMVSFLEDHRVKILRASGRLRFLNWYKVGWSQKFEHFGSGRFGSMNWSHTKTWDDLHIYLHEWLIFFIVDVGKYTILVHGWYGDEWIYHSHPSFFSLRCLDKCQLSLLSVLSLCFKITSLLYCCILWVVVTQSLNYSIYILLHYCCGGGGGGGGGASSCSCCNLLMLAGQWFLLVLFDSGARIAFSDSM